MGSNLFRYHSVISFLIPINQKFLFSKLSLIPLRNVIPYILFVQIIILYKGAAFTSRLCKHANDNEISPNQCHIHFGMNECMNNKAISSRGKWPVQETDKINEMGGRQSPQDGSLLTTLLTQIMQSTCKSLHFKIQASLRENSIN